MARSLSQLAKAASIWLSDARAHFGWSEEDLIDRISRLTTYFRVVRVPSLGDIQNLEAGREIHFPAWIKFARLAFELEELQTEEQRRRWAEQRSPWQGHAPHDELDFCWPLVSRPELNLLEHLDSMSENERRMAFRLAASWNSPYADRRKVFDATIKALSARMQVPPPKTLPGPVQELTPRLERFSIILVHSHMI